MALYLNENEIRKIVKISINIFLRLISSILYNSLIILLVLLVSLLFAFTFSVITILGDDS